MQSKSLLIAIAALAVTATGVHAHAGGSLLYRAQLSENQRAAIQEAAQLRAEGNITAARDVLVEAGIDESALAALRRAKSESHLVIHRAVEANDYQAFIKAIAGTPLADVITSEADFALFKEAHDLRHAGSHEEAAQRYDELGITPSMHRGAMNGRGHHHMNRGEWLSDEQREALRVAKQANDHDTVRAILKEAGVE